jgi:hypothetical protein
MLRDLDHLQHVRIHRRDRDWLARTDVAKPIAELFRHAHIALPPRAKQMAPPELAPPAKSARKRRGRADVVPRRREFRRNNPDINQLRSATRAPRAAWLVHHPAPMACLR